MDHGLLGGIRITIQDFDTSSLQSPTFTSGREEVLKLYRRKWLIVGGLLGERMSETTKRTRPTDMQDRTINEVDACGGKGHFNGTWAMSSGERSVRRRE